MFASRKPARALATLLLAVALTTSANAAEVLKLKNGDLVPGAVLELDGEGVTFAPERGGRMRVDWKRVHPVSRFELWQSTLAEDDAEGRVVLARWALSADLYSQARRTLLHAQGLGYDGEVDLDEMLDDVDRSAADTALAAVDGMIETGELDDALSRIRKFLRVAPPGEHADRVRARLPDLLTRIERRDLLAEEAREKEIDDKKRARRERWVISQFEDAKKTKERAVSNAIEAFGYLASGNQTRSRRGLKKAEKDFQKARETYRKLQRVLGADERAEIAKREVGDCDRRTLEVLTRWGRLEVGNKAWKKASPIVDRGLRIDPVNPELLALRETIDANWIRRKLSGITNATGRSSSN